MTTTTTSLPVFQHAGSMTEFYVANDWHASPLGSPAHWKPELTMALGIMLECRFPMFLMWGDSLTVLYNEACIEIMGKRHPSGLGKSLREIAPETVEQLEPIISQAWAGKPVRHDNLPFVLLRSGVEETAWFTISYSAVRYPDGSVAGVLCTCLETTEQLMAERAREMEIQRLRDMFEQSPIPMALLVGPEHRYVISNAANQHYLNNREVIGRTVREVLPELVEQGIVELLDQVYASGKALVTSDTPVRVCQPDGSIAEYHITGFYQPMRDSTGKVTGIFVQATDTTRYVKAAADLRESEERLRQLANTIPNLAWMADQDGNIHWYNDRWYSYTGTDLSTMRGWGWQSVQDPTVLPRVLERWKHSLATGEPFEMTFPLRGKDGTFRPFYTLIAPLRNAEGAIVQWFGTNTDVSSLQEAQQALERTEEWLQAGLMTARMVAWEWDLQSGSIRYSANVREVLGYDSDRTEVGFSTIDPDDQDQLRREILLASQENRYFQKITRRTRPDNQRVIWVDTRGKTYRGPDGEPLYVRGVSIDITDRVVAETALKESNRRKDDFLAMLAHELRNPLAPIATAAELLALPNLPDNQIRRASDIITRQSRHMVCLIDDLLDVSRITQGLITLDWDEVDLKPAVHAAAEQIRPLIESKGHRLDFSIDADCAVVRGDRTRLIQVISNLLSNAARYTADGGQIRVSLTREGGNAILRVDDNGSGIDPQFMPYVFDLFTQGKRTPDRSQGGLGIGLALVKNILDLHGAFIDVSSPGPNQGSTFRVQIPLVEVQKRSPDLSITAGASSGIRRRILVVDDNVDAATVLATWLELHGHEVMVTESARQALDCLEQFAPQVCILDIGLPAMDGYELVRAIRRHPVTAGACCIALTGYGQDHDHQRSIAAGFDHHFVKPVDSAKLSGFLRASSP